MIWGILVGAAITPIAGVLSLRMQRTPQRISAWGWVLLAAACISAAACAAAVKPVAAALVYILALTAVVAAAAVDVAEQRLPDVLTLGVGGAGFVALAVTSWATGVGSPWRALAGGAIFGGWILFGALVIREGYGLGDVKLAASLGILLAWHSWFALAMGISACQLVIAGILVSARLRGLPRVALGPAFAGGTVGAFAVLALT